MDPNACLADLRAAKERGDWTEVHAARLDLRAWVASGGFEPDDDTWREA